MKNKYKISSLLYFGFFSILFFIVLLIFFLQSKLEVVATTSKSAAQLGMPTVHSSHLISNGVAEALSSLRGWIILGEEKYKANRHMAWRHIRTAQKEMRSLSSNWTNPENIAYLNKIDSLLNSFEKSQQKIENIAKTQENRPALKILVQQAAPLAEIIIKQISTMVDEEKKITDISVDRKKLFAVLADFRGSLALSLSNIRIYLLTGNKIYQSKFYQLWENNQSQLNALSGMHYLLTKNQRKEYNLLIKNINKFSLLPKKIFTARANEKWNLSNYWLKTEAAPVGVELQAILQKMWNNQEELLSNDLIADTEKLTNLLQILWLTLFVVIVFAIVITRYITSKINIPINRAVNLSTQIAKGMFNTPVPSSTGTYETDRLLSSLEEMTKTLSEASTVTQEVAHGNLDVKVDVKGKSDMLALSLNKMVDTLRENHFSNKQSDWIHQGTFNLGQQLLGALDIDKTTKISIHYICEYIKAFVGVLYINNDSNTQLKLAASYAYESDTLAVTIPFGSGTLGEVAQSKKIIEHKHISNIYTADKSSITQHAEINTYAFALSYQNELYAVIEVATYHQLSNQQKEFLKQSESTIATALATAKSRQNIEILLANAHVQNEQMGQRQNALDAHSIVGITDVRGTITYANSKFTEISGYSNKELVGQNHRIVNSETYDKEFWKEMYKTVASGKIWHHPAIKNRCKDGSIYWVDTTIFPFMGANGKPESYIAIRTDVTKNKKAQVELIYAKNVAEQAVASKAEFLASMSHEIRTPMNGVLGMLGLLINTELNKEQHHQVSIAQSSAKSLLTVINDILDFSKMDANKLEIEVLDFNLINMLSEFTDAMSLAANEKNLELILDVSQIKHSMVKGDPGRIRQILNNIVGNALKFTHKGEIVIKVELTERTMTQYELSASIQDSGIGLTDKSMLAIFDSFSQADASTTRKYGGTGLGLSITKRLCQLMGGDINVSSELNKGSCFTFTILLEKSEQTELLIPSTDINLLDILIVDDNSTNRYVLRKQLENWGATVTEADSASEALKLCAVKAKKVLKNKQENFYDIALLDMKMPKMNGAGLAKKLKSDPRFCNMKLVLMSSVSTSGKANHYADLGFSAYFSKPVTVSDLYDALAIVSDNGDALKQAKPLVTKHYVQTLSRNTKGNAVQNLKNNWPNNIQVLVVDDNEVNQMVTCGMLKEFGIIATCANNGLSAIEILKKAENKPFTLIFMDCQMPVMDGFEATRQIRDNVAGKNYHQVPIVAMTANAMTGDRELCLDAGMDDYLTKPLDPKKVNEALIKWLPSKEKTNNVSQKNQLELTSSQQEEIEQENFVLPGFDLKLALPRMGGNVEAYKKTLIKAIEAEKDAIKCLKKYIYQGENQNAILVAHTLKGVFGNLGENTIYQLSSELEKALIENKNNYPEDLINKTEVALNNAILRMQNALTSKKNNQQSISINIDISAELESIASRIENFDSTVDSSVDDLLKQIGNNEVLAKPLRQLQLYLGNYDFDSALPVVYKILNMN